MESIESWISDSFPDAAQPVTDLLPNPSDPPARYGGFALRRGDWDASRGVQPDAGERMIRLAAEDQTVTRCGLYVDPTEERRPTISFPAYVERLQIDLWVLGFGLIRRESGFDGFFGRITEQAVREFQIYAGMEQVAQHDGKTGGNYVDHLSSTQNDRKYEGPISGRVNEETRTCITHWLNNDYRCPVVITARTEPSDSNKHTTLYNGDGIADGASANNLWRHDDLQSTAPRVFVVDFTGYYDIPSGGGSTDEEINANGHICLGEYNSYPADADNYGPVSKRYHVWDGAEITPQRLTGTAEPNLSEAEASTYEVVHAVGEIECLGHFDGVNAYDRALVSVGPCHWTLSLTDQRQAGDACAGELGGYLAYLQSEDSDAYDKAFGNFGVDLNHDWGQWDTDGDLGSYEPINSDEYNNPRLHNSQERKYTTWVQVQQWDDDANEVEWRSMPKEPVEDARAEALYFKSWHWFYRFVMAGRTVEPYRERMWDMARIRLRDVRSATVPWDSAPDGADWSASGENAVTIGDIFTSEKAAAMVHCWHIYTSGDVLPAPSVLEDAFDRARNGNHSVEGQVVNADDDDVPPRLDEDDIVISTPLLSTDGSELDGSQLDWTQAPPNWGDDHERALIAGLTRESAENGGDIPRRIGLLYLNYHNGVNLEDDRGSFLLSDNGIPEQP